MAVAYVLQPPDPSKGFPITLVLSGRTLVRKESLIPSVREFGSAAEARSHLDGIIRDHERAGFRLAGPHEVEDEILPERLGPRLTVAFDVATRRVTVEFGEEPSADMLDAISVRLWTYQARSLHLAVSWLPAKWDDPRHVPELAKALTPSLEAFIFDVPHETVERQSYNTVGDIGDMLAACPNLSRAFITGCSAMRETRHEHLRELYLMGNPLDASVLRGLAASQFPALDKLVLRQEHFPAADLAESLRSLDAPRLSHVYVDGVRVVELLPVIGTAALPWNLCLSDSNFDEVDELMESLERHDALRSGRLRLCSDGLFDSEIARLRDLGVTIDDMRDVFLPRYSNW